MQTLNAPARPQPTRPARHTTGRINYTKPAPKGEELYNCVGELYPGKEKWTTLERQPTQVEIKDLRAVEQKFTLKENGFQLVPFQVPEKLDWGNANDIEARYYPALEQLIKQHTGATRVHIFDHTPRRGTINDGSEEDSFKQQKYDNEGRRPPVPLAHVDYTTASGVNRLKALLPNEAEKLQKTPFAVIQVWRPIRGPVDDSPLAMIDVNSTSPEDFMPYKIYFPGRVGENYALAHSPKHKWYFAHGMQEDEAYIFTCYDSRSGRARFTPHTGFRDPNTPADAIERESVEARCYAFFEDEPEQEPVMELY